MKKVVMILWVVSLLSVMVLSGCSKETTKETTNEKGSAEVEAEVEGQDYPEGTLNFVAPSGAGGGWDMTIRTTAKILKDTNLVSVPMPVTNVSGGGGAVNLAEMQSAIGHDDLVVVYSSPLLLINLNGSTEYSYKDTTPLARLITDYGAFVVSEDSKYNSIKEVMDALKADPKSVKIGGASSVGSMDHIQFLLIAKAAGVTNLKEIDYISFQDGTANAQILGGHVDILSTGLGDVSALLESGNLKGLAITAPERVSAEALKDIPTCKEEGIDAVFENWRGLFGPKDMPDYAVSYWEETLGKMVETTEWLDASNQNGWAQCYLNATDFTSFLDETNEAYKGILEEIGMLEQ